MKIITKKKKANGRVHIYLVGIKLFSYKTKPEIETQINRFPNTEIKYPEGIDKNTTIGEYTSVGEDVSITKTTIGRYCSVAPHVRIGSGEHDINLISTSSFLFDGDWYEKLTQNECTIGHDVWIGTESIIRRGVKVGNFAVIGANSFVNKDVPEFAVVAGSPARIIKYRFTPQMREKIKKSRYWEYPPEKAKNILKQIQEKK